jgi:hypothetical protein
LDGEHGVARAEHVGVSDHPVLPRDPFTYGQLTQLGVTRHTLRRLVAERAVRRLLIGVYVRADVHLTVELRARAVAAVVPAHHVVRDRTAAWIHGIDVMTYAEHDVPPPIETCALRGHDPCTREGVAGRTRDLAPNDIVVLQGLRVTSPLRTALDLGCLLRRRDALAALDAFARSYGLTKQQLRLGSRRYRRRRGVLQLRELIELVDPRAESPRESWLRLSIHDAGLPSPHPQFWIEVDGIRIYRLDLAYRFARVAVEYDGWEAHQRTQEQRDNDRARRKWLSEHGWTVVVVRRGDFTGTALDRWLAELKEALKPMYSNVRRMERGSRLVRHA